MTTIGAAAGRLTSAGFRLAWVLVRLLPEGPTYRLAESLADHVTRRDGPGVRRLRANLARAVPPQRLEAAVADGMRAYVRYWLDAFRLPSWSRSRRVGTVRVTGLDPLRHCLDSGRGAVAALAHLGNWDHAGAWAAAELAPVTSVAERLRPESLYRSFVAFRARLGIDILPLTAGEAGAPGYSAAEQVAVRLRHGAFVPLLADRDLTGRGTTVDLLGEPAAVAGGPAALAARTGAALFPVTCHTERHAASPSGWGLVLTVHPEVPVTGAGPDSVAGAMQQCADRWSQAIREHPADWHMLQRVFLADLGRD